MIQKNITAQREIRSTEAAAAFVQLAMACQSQLKLEAEGRCVNPKSLLGVLCLGIEAGSSLTLTAEGPDEEEAWRELAAFFKAQ